MLGKKIVVAAALAATSALLLAGCSAANPGSSDGGDGEVTWNEPTADLSGVTLTYWTATQTATMADQVIDAFEDQTGAKIDKVIIPDVYETNAPTKLASGAKPDLATWQPTASVLALLQPKTGLQNLDTAPWLDTLSPAIQKLGTVDGTHYAAFVNVPSVIGVFYNKDVFAKAGITDTPANFDELLADSQKIKDAGVSPFFGAAGDSWPTQWWPQVLLAEKARDGLWDRVNSNEDTFTGDDIQGAITEYKDMLDAGYFNDDNGTSTYNESGPALLNGEAGMVLQISSFVSLLQSTADTATINDTIGWFPISKDGNIGTSVPGGDSALVAPKTGDPKKEAAARQFLRFWMETDYASYVESSKQVSIEPSVETPSDVPEVAQVAADALENSVGSMQQDAVVNPDFYKFLADMVHGTKTPEEVGQLTQAQFEQLAKALGVSGF
ncbi:ABC transporter substrate-binding protein [Compostimonas suwonensis]|uniref:Raffinose/stachyose/melibiose transport system substrate-binding protein n=1 Tax=Compostimonas suwonensis TaxID=1048394 RepID=A0A2M9BCB7_9MICO|nr:ABC transporter substrate-binding protein [Compostimonas suwonensis]PJJ55581.1 raffinose/stachyose/melibiose transport system substrate-binding protein [Compostimonas suwonensis]